jgi:hypothetical protein
MPQPDLLVLMVGTLVVVASIFNSLTPLQQTEPFDEGWFIAGRTRQHCHLSQFGRKEFAHGVH